MEIAVASEPTKKLSKKKRKRNAERKPRKQSGVIPYRVRNGYVEILLVSSSHSGKWGIPKGGVEPDLTKRESASTEAFEEAGLKGKAKKRLGEFTYVKGATGRPQHVVVYAMRVKRELNDWMESHRRERKWFTLKQAKKKLPRHFGPMLDKVQVIALS
tara:strand:+ start:27560 stop:28033 length:474 start_codon:yes stop_codon:yes gene_type:complete